MTSVCLSVCVFSACPSTYLVIHNEFVNHLLYFANLNYFNMLSFRFSLSKFIKRNFCKFGNFRVTFISRIFDSPITSKFLNSQASASAVYQFYNNSLARTLFSRGNDFLNISEN